MKKTVNVDVAIFGGGVAGLWLLSRLRQAGYSAILLESGSLGGGQTNKAQGIIHGGMKYALQGRLTNEARGMADLPDLWNRCLQGQGEIDLQQVKILSQHQCLWAPSKLTAKLAGFFAGAALASQVKALTQEEYPTVFQHAAFKGEVFKLDETVIDVPSLVRALFKANREAVFRIEPLCEEELHFTENNELQSVAVYMAGDSVHIEAQQFVFTAGAGNELITRKLNHPALQMQLRPLHMVMVKLPFDFPLYAHCLGIGTRPRMTITTHYLHDGTLVWYLGGALAEEGVQRDEAAQIIAARKELAALFTWLDFSEAAFSTFMVNRAEPLQKGGIKPESTYAKFMQNVTVAWPTKLALAPKLAAEILQHMQQIKLTPQCPDLREMRAWPMPTIAKPVWEEVFC